MDASLKTTPLDGACVLIHDDGYRSFKTCTLPHLNHDRPMALAIMAEEVNRPDSERSKDILTWEEIHELCDNPDYNITTCTHMVKTLVPLFNDNLSLDEFYESKRKLLVENIRLLKSHGLRWEACVYACGDHDANIRNICSSLFDVALGVSPFLASHSSPRWALPRLGLQLIPSARYPNHFMDKLKSLRHAPKRSFSYTAKPLEYFVKKAKEEKKVLFLFDHGAEHFSGFGWPEVFDILEEHQLPVVPLYDVVEQFCKIPQTKDMILTHDSRAWGSVDSSACLFVKDGAAPGTYKKKYAKICRLRQFAWRIRCNYKKVK